MDKLSEKRVVKFRSLFPREVTVAVRRSEDGGFSAEILSYPRTFTEAETFSELLEMINNALYTYFDVPEKYVSFMPTYLPSVKSAKDLMGFPVRQTDEEIKLELADRETVRN